MNDHKKEEFIEDPRYKQCNKEALMGIGLGILNLIWWYAFGYGLGSQAPEEYTYIMGLPMWFFMSCIVGGILFSSLAIIMVSKFFKDMPLDKIDLQDEDKI
ncbi:MAG: YhdT family protein [Marinisporobacter sp.]|jgi:uncharacterized membrane protein YhdT|nr:YhdT family protein [Marinisporobacter sp.]